MYLEMGNFQKRVGIIHGNHTEMAETNIVYPSYNGVFRLNIQVFR